MRGKQHRHPTKSEVDNARFGEILLRYRTSQGLSQGKLRDRLEDELDDDDLTIWNKSTICKWEQGKCMPKREVVEALDDILGTDGVLLNAAGYAVDGIGATGRGKGGSIRKDRSVWRPNRIMSDHFSCLAEIAAELLGGELDTVARMNPDLLSESATVHEMYKVTFRIGMGGNRHEMHGSKITQMLMDNWYSVYGCRGLAQMDSFMHHLIVHFPRLPRQLFDQRDIRPTFEYLAVNLPLSLINTLRELRNSEEIKGKCEICKDQTSNLW